MKTMGPGEKSNQIRSSNLQNGIARDDIFRNQA